MEWMKKWDVFVCGDINVDLLIPGADRLPPPGEEWEVSSMETTPGGGAALFALGLGKLGMRPVFQGRVGDDFFGEYLSGCMSDVGVDTLLLKKVEGTRTGISISFTTPKERSFLTFRGSCGVADLRDISFEYMQQARHVHLTGYAGSQNHEMYADFLEKLRKSSTDITVSFDVGWDPAGEWSERIYELFPLVDILFMNETECVHYSKMETAEQGVVSFAKQGCLAVAKLGKKGAIACRDGRVYKCKGFPVVAVDTTGAGDSFNAGFVYGFLQGADIMGMLSYGNGCGALSCTGFGGNTNFPTEEELLGFVERS